ncbi:hypothetical protein I302_104873 [Kwoniella bestiolae CBS 10118]|uniref:Elongator complex protein 2 n=1 Tax=Kwoniella bestiolae CBS 10118 TaxID=1296100 RepID=A0A1B9FRI1_9TREE|nr:elongator complex protein 2 [Kwoniella bestiolae CBS 10118]OCF21379.1 elongator complex protein 2 [Kwoniella bestiolae CBS 10118]
MRVNPTYISIGSNRSSSCSAITPSGLLAFGAGKLLALWDTESTSSHGVQRTLPGHKGQITTVKLVSSSSGDKFISGDTNGEIRVWSSTGGEWKCEKSWTAHEGSSISAIGISPSGWIITGGSDSKIKIWDEEYKEKQVIKLEKGRLPLDLDLATLPGSKAPILAVGATDRLIRIYTLTPNHEFTLSLTLEGHEDWVRCLSFTSYPSHDQTKEDLFLASGAQDNFIRLWRVSSIPAQQAEQIQIDEKKEASAEGLDLLDEFERRLNGEGSGQISTKAHILAVQDGPNPLRYNITLEALLVGHESGLTNLHWSSPSPTQPNPLLLSTASDNSLIIWVPSSDGIWIPEHRFGAIGGRGLSFYGAIWGKGGRSVLASGWNGGWERWVKTAGEDGEEEWQVKSGTNGHYGDVQSLSWDPREEYLISVGTDQTSRIHATTSLASSSTSTSQWAEIARPQIHGYDMTDIAFISPLRFISSADEKVARVFDAPEGFVESLRTLGVSEGSKAQEGLRPKGATVPPLGLSNRALQKAPAHSDKIEKEGMNEAIISISHTLTSLPTEEELATSTLWPEMEKIYGHGYELVCVASSHYTLDQAGSEIVATSSKSTNLEHSGIRLYSTNNWELYGEVLKGHSLTVTRIQFSHDDDLMLSCSRDRSWRLFKHNKDRKSYEPIVEQEKAHARMILDCCFAKGDSGVFATASRDKTVKIWIPTNEDKSNWKCTETIKFNEATTSVDMIPYQDGYLLAVGTEIGSMSIYSLTKESGDIKAEVLTTLDESISHVGPVNRLAWRRQDGKYQLASCSDDRSVRVFDIEL